jgi:heptosyltransferase-1
MIRLGSMGDIIHAMPAAHCLQGIAGGSEVTWAVEPRWLPLFDRAAGWNLLPIDRTSFRRIRESIRRLRTQSFDLVVDLQGLLKSAMTARLAKAPKIVGFSREQCREPLAARFYSEPVKAKSEHIIDRYLDVAVAAGGRDRTHRFAIAEGREEHPLPDGPYVLASPLAGWRAKQWPFERYTQLASWLKSELSLTLVINMPPGSSDVIEGTFRHVSGIGGLIHATRRATAVLGLDSGPMHLAAALGIPGVALFGPTDPDRNGPAGVSFTVLRDPGAVTSYKRRDDFDTGMLRLTADQVFAALRDCLRGCA